MLPVAQPLDPMGETVVPKGSTVKLGRVEGGLSAENHAFIQAVDGSGVVVARTASFEGSCEVDCDLECGSLESWDGLVRVERRGRFTIEAR